MTPSPQSIAGLSLTEKRMLLAELLREKSKRDASTSPLAHGQRGLWFLYQMDRSSPAYNIFFPARILSRVDVPAFRRAVQLLIDRHPSLRTTFEERDGQLTQRIHERSESALEVLDASTWSEETLHRRVEEEAYRPFDLEKGPLVRMFLFTRAPEDHVFLLTAHHIIGDFWSLVLLMEEMQLLYPAQRDGKPLTLPPPTSQYRDFVRWQADMLAGPEGERLAAYWQEKLAGVPAVLDLPTDRPRPARFTHRGAAVSCRIDPELTGRLKGFAAAESVTPYTVLLSVFQVLLARYSGQQDFAIGSPFAGRSRPEFERVAGYFINMLPLRADLSGGPTFRELLHRVSATVLEALEHQDYPFQLLIERLKLKRDPNRAPLVQASFTLERAHRPVGMGCWSFFLPQSEVRLNVGGLRAEPYHVEHRTCQLDLEMVMEEGDGAIYGMLRYNADLFDEDTITRLGEHYLTLLKHAINDPYSSVLELPLMMPNEERLLYEWNDTRADYPRDLCLHQLFEQQAARTPEAVALRFADRLISYAELDAWANRLAHRLRRYGVGRNSMVALCLERSPEMVAALLAVLKAGGAYVPLDPATPLERLRAVLEDIRSPLILTQRRLIERLSALGIECICLDEPEEGGRLAPRVGAALAERVLHDQSSCAPESGVQPGDLAYVIYTSGSTGRPKGVLIEHRAIVNTICWHREVLTVRPDDRLLFFIPICFDASICVLFPALAAGAEIVLTDPGEERDPVRLLERLRRDGVTILPIPPRLLRLMLDDRLREAGRWLRWVCCGGEPMPPDLPDRLFELLDVRLYNLYGPTEVAVDATCWPCRRDEDRPIIPIGRPIANVQVYVLDEQRRPTPIGVPGELYIGGAGLARGYLNDPELTAERFVPDPFAPPHPQPLSPEAGERGETCSPLPPSPPGGGRGVGGEGESARLYRTGDRCRWRAEGCLEFLGRLDAQVKVRGYRIEIGEVEAALASHPSVDESAVVVCGDEEAGERLVGYVSARPGGGIPTPELLRRYLRERLPDYMVPSTFVLLPSLPHLTSGKVDRKALPAPRAERQLASHPYVAPRTALEEFLAVLWRDLLRVQQIGVLDNFFELGGNSIQGAVLINRLQEALGQQIYTIALFDSPTIAGLAQYLIALCPEVIRQRFGSESLSVSRDGPTPDNEKSLAAPSGTSSLLVPLQPKGMKPPCFMVHPPGGIVVCYQALALRLGDDRPFYGIRARGLHGETDLPERLEDMAAEYVAAVRSIQPEGPYHLGGWSMGGIVALEMAQQLLAQGQQIALLALLDTTIPQNAANQPYAEEAGQSAREYGLDLTLEELDRLGPDEQLPYLWNHVQKLGLVDDNTPLPLVQQILDDLKRLFHAHIKLANDYVVRPYPGRITLFRPIDSPVPVETARDRNWGRLAAVVDVHFVPGHHHSMVKEPHVQILAELLRTCLEGT